MKKYPGLKIEIQGYVCCIDDGGDGWDIETRKYDLLVQRAKIIYTYLVNYGISTSRINYK